VTRVVTENEFRDELPKILDAMDQPTIGGLTAWFLSKAVRELGVKVAISAVGGDQLFGDYQPSSEVQRWVRALATPARIPGLRKLARWFLPRQLLDLVHPKAAALLEFGGGLPGAYLARRGLFMPWELENLLGPETSRSGLRRLNPIRHITACLAPHPRTAFDKRAVLEWSLYTRNQVLRDMDWASMAHSIELRAPLLDVRLLRQAAIAVQDKKLQSRTVLASSPRVPLPARIAHHRKAKSGQPINWLQEDARFQRWRTIPSLSSDSCPGVRRWALQIVPT
jgi:asparagine synthase (glutamine-hydrolysing)